MTAIFHELIKDNMEVFMDDFSVFGSSFNHCLKNLEKMLKRCEETNLVLNWEKYHFMVKEGIVLGHKVSGSGIEVDKAKIEEFDFEIRDKRGAKNLAADHLSRLENPDLERLTRAEIRDLFPEELLMTVSDKNNEPCVTTDHSKGIMASPPPQGKSSRPGFIGHMSFVMRGNWSKFVMHVSGPETFPRETKHLKITFKSVKYSIDARNVVNFLKRLFARFRIPKALISDRGTHFYNYQIEKAMKRYGVVHRFSTTYHPQTNGHVKNTNRALKRILEKTTGNNRKDWSYKLDDALWAFRTAFKTPLGTTPFKIIYGKACRLPVELEHKAY
ncbi:reverse transcriptase domain-containing protein [Tanacetum coccineum]